MEHTAHITPEEVIEAYEETGWVPIRDKFMDPGLLTLDGVTTGGCGLGVISAHQDLVSEVEIIGLPENVSSFGPLYRKYGQDYIVFFIRGFDQGFECEDESAVEDWQDKWWSTSFALRALQGAVDGSWCGFRAREYRLKLANMRKEELAPA